MSEGLDVFRDGNVKELLATLDVPIEVRRTMDAPEQVFDALPDISGGVDQLTCSDLGASDALRNRKPRLDNLCSELEDLLSFDTVKDAFQRVQELPDDVLDAIAEVMKPVLNDVGESGAQTRSRFCNSNVGQRKAFDRYCGR